MEELADKRLAPQELDKQNNLKETKKTNIFKMLIETKKGKKITMKRQAWNGTKLNMDKLKM